ncbi:MFS transporter [Salmonella enterica subsp. enterica serovar Typhimurium]|nr:MFS transporter [Salmonella enterica]EGY7184942.1 MFS transporter [Salmonella enterica subsp. enterica serovar Typhimurium]
MSTYTRPVMLLLCGLLLLTLAIAVLNTLVPLWLAQANLPTWQVGMVSSSYFTGNLVGTLFTGYLIKRIGFNRSYYLASLIFAAGCVGLGVMVGFWSWMSWRFIAGIGCAMIWVVVESALMCSGTSHNRGRLLAAYMMVYYMGTFLGQLLVSKVSGELLHVLPWVTGMILAGILPLLFTRIVNQQTQARHSSSISAMLKHQGMANASIGFWMAVLVSAGILGQWPMGRLADKFGRLLVLRVQVFVVILGSIAMLTQAAMAPALFILGAAGFTLYPVAMAWACEKVEHHQLVAMNQALLLSYTVGSLLGPSFAAMLMQNYSDNLLFIMIASVSFIYLLMLLRNAGQTPNPVAHI